METSKSEYFFDCHCHTMTLGQVNVTSFLENLLKNTDWEVLLGIVGSNPHSSARKTGGHVKKVLNLLTLMQNDLVDIFNTMEDDLKGKFGGETLADKEGLQLNGHTYRKLVLTPLLMDFKPLPGSISSTYYPYPRKELRTVINEYSFAIKQYYRDRPHGLLYILPFLGINPAAYSYKELKLIIENSFGLSKLKKINKSVRGSELLTVMAGHFSPQKMFAGIKLYPPMGYDPWPGDKNEREKVEFLYSYAQEASIPITTHCNDGGFVTVNYKQAVHNTHPSTWAKVLEHYPDLYLNFAHAGFSTLPHIPKPFGKKEKSWTDVIFDLIDKYENVYTDFSFNGISPKFYDKFTLLLSELNEAGRTRYMDKVLFGTDFMINLMGIESYRNYYDLFQNSPLDPELRHRFASINPHSFLNL
ncbi:MAG: amidohydrolase family protein [Spirochaetaceae bacterium]|nr:amidohydrolase family protein [Spirochaetaceae bacterium]